MSVVRVGNNALSGVARMQEYADPGIDTFVLSGYPHLEEAYRYAELVFPLLPREQLAQALQAALAGPFGEIVANQYVPKVAAG